MWPISYGTLLPGLAECCSLDHPVTPGPTPGHEFVDTYSACRCWESRFLQSSSTEWRANLRRAFCREPWPCSRGSPWGQWPRPWAVAPPEAELWRAMFPEKQARDKSAVSPVTSLCPKPLVAAASGPLRPSPLMGTSPSHRLHTLLSRTLKDPIFPCQVLVG